MSNSIIHFSFRKIQYKKFINCNKQYFWYIYTENIWSFDHTITKNAHQRGSVLKDDIWQDLTEHESKFELVEDGIESEKEKI